MLCENLLYSLNWEPSTNMSSNFTVDPQETYDRPKSLLFFEKNSFNHRNTRKRCEICSKLTIKGTYLKQGKNHLAIQIHHFMLGVYFFIFGSKGFFYCSRISTWRAKYMRPYTF